MTSRPRPAQLVALLLAGLMLGCATPGAPAASGHFLAPPTSAAPRPQGEAPQRGEVVGAPGPSVSTRPRPLATPALGAGERASRAYAAPPRHADALAALAEADHAATGAAAAGQPSGFVHGAGTLWRWATGAFRRGDDVVIAPRGEAPAPDAFWLGANLPWVDYGGDFGANAWHPTGGLSRPASQDRLEAAFARFAAAGVKRVRWFMFCDGRAGLRFAPDGTPLGLDDHVLADVEVALAAARRHDIRIMFALLDFYFLQAAEVSGGVRMRGHADVFRDPAKRRAFMDTVVAPLADRYGDDPAILAWDVINEPEWSVFGAGAWKPAQSVAAADLRAFVREATATLHARATQPVTVGSASTRWLDLVTGLGLDFYQPHWYDHFERKAPLGRPVAELGLDRPVVLGEFPTRGSKKAPGQVLDAVRGAGYGGGFAWAQLSSDEATDWDAAEPALVGWLQEHAGALAP